jgi:nitrite reductase/ring-hydroxylating ferredoxin subunit
MASAPAAFIVVANRDGGFVMADHAENIVRVCSKSEVAPDSVKAFEVGQRRLAVYNIDGTYYITDDECTHAAASLADGMLEGDVIECCMHMGSFHVPTGRVVEPPCEVPLRTYRVILKEEDVFADLDRNAAGEPA